MELNKFFKLSALSAALLVVSAPVYSGQIIGVQQGTPSPVLIDADEYKNGFGGWNLDNVNVKIVDLDGNDVGKTYNPVDGSYTAMVVGDTFVSEVKDDAGNVMGLLKGKDWPVGEPSGIKVITTDAITDLSNGKPASCIMSTSYYKNSDDPKNYDVDGNYIGPGLETDGWLDSAAPNPTVCSSPYQTHKRLKVSALPSTVDGTGSDAIDIVLNLDTVNAETDVRRYTVLQKLNNYTDAVLAGGFKIVLGTGVGQNFSKLDTSDAALMSQLRLSIGAGDGSDFWATEDLATFSEGLFGTNNDVDPPEYGFFSRQRALYPVALTDAATFQSTGALSTNYTSLFGDWIPSTMVPNGIFFDDDGDPLTDAKLMAFEKDDPSTPDVVDLKWFLGNEDGFALLDDTTLASWDVDGVGSAYTTGEIEDLLNLGLSYMVEIGDVSAVTNLTGSDSITIRMVPLTVAEVIDNTTPAPSTSSGGSASVVSQYGFIALLLAFLGLGGWIVRNKLSK